MRDPLFSDAESITGVSSGQLALLRRRVARDPRWVDHLDIPQLEAPASANRRSIAYPGGRSRDRRHPAGPGRGDNQGRSTDGWIQVVARAAGTLGAGSRGLPDRLPPGWTRPAHRVAELRPHGRRRCGGGGPTVEAVRSSEPSWPVDTDHARAGRGPSRDAGGGSGHDPQTRHGVVQGRRSQAEGTRAYREPRGGLSPLEARPVLPAFIP